MSEFEILSLARDARAGLNGDFAQIIAITFAMVIGIYYFLNQAKVGFKLFAFAAYSIGMFFYLGMMLGESSTMVTAMNALRAISGEKRSMLATQMLNLSGSWITDLTSAMVNTGFWVLWLGIGYLLFFWRRDGSPLPHQ